jgi:hypothetical protein
MAKGQRYGPVRVIWLDSCSLGKSYWISPEDLEEETWGTLPVQETVGFLFGMRDEFLCVIQSQGAGTGEDLEMVGAPFAIPFRAILSIETLVSGEVIYEG